MHLKSNLERDFLKKHNLRYETKSLPYTIVHRYTPDWTVNDGTFIETKGLWTGADRTKIKTVLKQHPSVKILMAFQNPKRKLSKTSSTTYADWCDRHGIQHCAATDTEAVQRFINAAK